MTGIFNQVVLEEQQKIRSAHYVNELEYFLHQFTLFSRQSII